MGGGAGEKSSPQETKGSISFSANTCIADMGIPFQIIKNVIFTPRYLILLTFSRAVPSRI